MSLYSSLLIIFILICLAFIALALKGLLDDYFDISAKEPRLQESLKAFLNSPVEPRFAPPAILSHDNWASFEGRVPGLVQVIVLADTVDAPVNGLQKAVLENFRRGVNYCFIVSNSKAEEEMHGFFGIFERLADIAIHKFGVKSKLEELVSILKLPDEWNNVPYVFYRLKVASGTTGDHLRTIAFRGDTVNAGIANRYIAVDQDSAEALIKLLMGKPPEKIEPAVMSIEQDEFVDPTPIVASTLTIVNFTVNEQDVA